MIKAMLNVENNQDITQRKKGIVQKKLQKFVHAKILISLLQRRQMIGIFMFKVVAVMGILGACRREELEISLNNIEDLGNTLVVNIPDSKTRVSRTFTVITETYLSIYIFKTQSDFFSGFVLGFYLTDLDAIFYASIHRCVITNYHKSLLRSFLALRPAHVNHQRLFIKYTSNKCTI
ncbi:hypothetical protein NQ317_006599 [Molorchus minor]|uniref:Uncharacterized protein n=1 Tax=Molorchus minor TaxID=1323400 RepID=A0ABQ9JZL7_9CUCU|nr:hypothetical protein NQ317_006599 [Molorchus minor]